ncbi:inositol monophosphatase/fructose-1,6-bisphosphatase family protein [Corynebacterium mustelae]|uniref:Inositol-1-monophosphatase n=1 Tax=Corynebacterium mustelae TaxID=571915 RepID=A0A0G3H2N7_9CORY|nr:inositol monophosphatase family protein [Corynebacterium mustelae]AKK06103.1 inositol monophosphatase/fructose-1,6-bisphosphatase family protein [Corynebacterium mustelae]
MSRYPWQLSKISIDAHGESTPIRCASFDYDFTPIFSRVKAEGTHGHGCHELISVMFEALIKAASTIVQERTKVEERGALADVTSTKSSAEDPVTIVDMAAEKAVAATLKKLRPQDGLIGEEGSNLLGTSSATWIVDPIDGTVNFIYGHPQYAVSLACVVAGKIVVGGVLNVATGQLWCAVSGVGAWTVWPSSVGGQARLLGCSGARQLELALVATGFSYSSHWREQQAEFLSTVLPQVRDIRRRGSAALDLCAVAEGLVDAYYEHGINAWDFAAGALIASEAGAVVSTPQLTTPGSDGEIVWAAAPGIGDQFSSLISALPVALATKL